MISFSHVSFRYPGAAASVLRDLSLALPDGAFTVVAGASGAGKSTLLRCINGLVPHFSGGTFSGRVSVNGLEPVTARPETMCWHVGFVFQDPEAQFVMDQVEDETAFALENAALPRAEMRERIEEVLDLLDLSRYRHRSLTTLSGGEKQRVAIAAALALRPRVLVLDEPTSQLDPQSAEDVLETLTRLNRALGLTIVLAEHRLERVLAFADRLVYLRGPAEADLPEVIAGTPQDVLPQIDLVPPVVALGKALGWHPLPVTPEAARTVIQRDHNGAGPDPCVARAANALPDADNAGSQAGSGASDPPTGAVGDSCVYAEGLEVAYSGTPVLRGVSITLHRGEVTVMMGRNGAGKSTLLRTLVGLVRPRKGKVWVEGRETSRMGVADICRQVAYLAQDPNALLFAETVLEELLITLRNHGISPDAAPIPPERLLDRLGLSAKADAYPRDLSVGERQRVALAAVTVTEPAAVLLDEPTRGLDYDAKAHLLALIRGWRAAGRAVLLVTHDVELAAAAADRVVLLDQGAIVAQGRPQEILPAHPEFAPQIARLFPETGWLTVDDALAALRR